MNKYIHLAHIAQAIINSIEGAAAMYEIGDHYSTDRQLCDADHYAQVMMRQCQMARIEAFTSQQEIGTITNE